MVNPLRQFGLLSHIKSIIVSHHIAGQPNTKLPTYLVQTPAKTQVSFVCFSKASLLKSINSNSNKSLLIKSNSKYQIICTVQNCCLALSVRNTILGKYKPRTFLQRKGKPAVNTYLWKTHNILLADIFPIAYAEINIYTNLYTGTHF